MTATPLYHVWDYSNTDRKFWEEHLEAWLPERIFDAHTHVQEPQHRIISMTDAMRKQYWVNEVFEPISAADAQRCYEQVFPDRSFSCLAFGVPSLEFDVEAGNKQLASDADERGWKSLAVTLPSMSAAELSEELDRPSVVGAKPYYALISHDPTSRDKHLEASIFDFLPHHQLELLNTRQAWVTLHVPRAGRLCDPKNIREVQTIREKYPDIALVIAHLGRCYTLEHAKEALPQLANDHGLYFDTSAVLNPAVLRFALETVEPERILYGTDNPIFYMRGRRSWSGATYKNYTNYPFHFNQQREAPEIEANYTLYMYEALKAFKSGCDDLALDRLSIERMFSKNAESLIARANCKKELRSSCSGDLPSNGSCQP
ncbi:amidohydrolase family protein [Adhaeretor mobilis]|uniref:Amidohydrolase n=1 Tax=Adhaeretor mobilis TaxID=1930276 RepID=A0A517MTL6_9BACT|nr:amidohydrolase family protein [Adhaeretor mobilis]QDS98202.1 Amidohydrolase [Adhaeretor mobilis]